MALSNEEKLGALICERTPYDSMEFPDDWDKEIEWDAKSVLWHFRESPHRVAKAIRIPVIVKVKKGNKTESYYDWLLIGYEGGGGQ